MTTDQHITNHTRSSLTVALPLLGLAAGVGVWWAAARISDNAYILPTPMAVLDAFARLPGYLLTQARVTLVETLVGFVLAVLSGLAIGLLIAGNRTIDRTVSPLLVAFNAVPKIALAPLLVLCMGFDMPPKVVMVVLVCFFPIVLATVTGLTTTPAELAELIRSLDASRWQAFAKVRFPAALPQIFVGLKVAMPLGVIGAVIGEFVGASAGLGYTINQASSVDPPLSFAAIVLLCVLSLALFYALVVVERLALPWVRETTSRH